MASLRRLLVLMLLGTARAAAGDGCAADGSSAAYTETITTQQGVEKRTITSTGCPNGSTGTASLAATDTDDTKN